MSGGLTEEFRRVQTPQRSGGSVAPSTTGSQRQATVGTDQGLVQGGGGAGQTAYPERGARGPAMRSAPNSFAFRVQDEVEMKAYRETYFDFGATPIAVGGTATLDPNVATNFVARAAGNLTIAVTPAKAPPDFDPYASAPQFLVGVKLWLYRPKGAVVTWSGVSWSKDVTDPAGDGSKPSLLAAAAADGWDSYVLVLIPGAKTFGYLAGRGYAA